MWTEALIILARFHCVVYTEFTNLIQRERKPKKGVIRLFCLADLSRFFTSYLILLWVLLAVLRLKGK